jgi:predicted RNase H-like HicB family nuclease
MPHYVAIVEEGGPEKAVGVWFPDLPGCFSAGDDIDEALRHAQEALASMLIHKPSKAERFLCRIPSLP